MRTIAALGPYQVLLLLQTKANLQCPIVVKSRMTSGFTRLYQNHTKAGQQLKRLSPYSDNSKITYQSSYLYEFVNQSPRAT